MATVNFLYRSIKPKANLTIRFYYNNKNGNNFIEVKTDIEVTKAYWEKHHFNTKLKNEKLICYRNDILQKLLNIESILLKKYNNTSTLNINKRWLTEALTKNGVKEINEKVQLGLVNYFDVIILHKKHELKKNTLKKYSFVKRLLIKFEEEAQNKFSFVDMSYLFKQQFIEYCLKEGYAKSTIKRTVSLIKTVCLFASKNGVEVNDQFRNWQTKLKDTNLLKKPVFLNFEELGRINRLKLQKKQLIDVRDWLIISCYTGQRFSDFIRFNTDMIYHDNGDAFIEFTQQKTNKKMVIAVHKVVLELLKKRNGNFPDKISLWSYNKNLKKICKSAGITKPTYGLKNRGAVNKSVIGYFEKWELISSHVGRRSFATNFYGLIPTSLLKSATGHSTEKMFLIYIGKTDSENAKQLHKFFN
ncbi:MAG: site-specific integrase [Winogradskyella sp.]